ncbi:MAG: hypothetical protein K2Q26_04625 [Bdellovibrionales bacterium]|nr:hypothetical protein [Bdellovibrionales bacterium]
MKIATVLILLLLLGGANVAMAQEPISVRVVLDHNTNYPNWTLRYEFPQSVYAFAFVRQDGGFRSTQWNVLPNSIGEADIKFAGDKVDIVRGVNEAHEFRLANLLIPFDSNNSDRYGYQFIQKFQGQSRAVFSEHFAISVWIKKNGAVEQRQANLEFTFVPHSSERLVLLNRESDSALYLVSPAGARGVYVYFGRERLRKINGFNFLFDRCLPSKITKYLSKNLSGILDFYRQRFGDLDFTPVIFVRHIPATPGYEHGASGDALPGMFLMRIFGSGYLNKGQQPEDFEPVA